MDREKVAERLHDTWADLAEAGNALGTDADPEAFQALQDVLNVVKDAEMYLEGVSERRYAVVERHAQGSGGRA